MPHSMKTERNCVTNNTQTCSTSKYPCFSSFDFDCLIDMPLTNTLFTGFLRLQKTSLSLFMVIPCKDIPGEHIQITLSSFRKLYYNFISY